MHQTHEQVVLGLKQNVRRLQEALEEHMAHAEEMKKQRDKALLLLSELSEEMKALKGEK